MMGAIVRTNVSRDGRSGRRVKIVLANLCPDFMPVGMSTNTSVDEGKLQEFMGKALGDMGAALNAALVLLGDELGLYKAMAGAGALTAGQLAEKTGTYERYVREWLSAQAASGYVTYDAASETFTLPPEQAMALAQEGSPVFIPGAFQIIRSAMLDEPVVREAFKSGAGVGWHEHSPDLFRGTQRFFRPSYAAQSVNGFRRSTGWWKSWSAERAWRMWVAGTEPRRS